MWLKWSSFFLNPIKHAILSLLCRCAPWCRNPDLVFYKKIGVEIQLCFLNSSHWCSNYCTVLNQGVRQRFARKKCALSRPHDFGRFLKVRERIFAWKFRIPIASSYPCDICFSIITYLSVSELSNHGTASCVARTAVYTLDLRFT